jgi:ankyrin repeat protein
LVDDEIQDESNIFEQLKIFVSSGGDLSYKDKKGRTAFHLAAIYTYSNILKFMLSKFPKILEQETDTGFSGTFKKIQRRLWV